MMNIFRTLRERWQPPQQTGKAYNLSEAAVHSLRHLRTLNEWTIYQSAVDVQIKLIGEQLLSSKDSYQDILLKGMILGLQKAASLPDELETREQLDAGERSRRQQSTERTESARATATFGTPAWKRTSG